MGALQRIFTGDYNPPTTILWYFIFLVLKVLIQIFLGPVSLFINVALSVVIGYGLIQSAINHDDSWFITRIFCWLLAFSQIGSMIMVRI
jgi:hypothetical protein